MAGHIQQGNDLHTLILSIADNGFHVIFGKGIAIGIIIEIVVSLQDGSLDGITIKQSSTAILDSHIIKHKAQTTVAERQLQLVEAVFSHGVNDSLNIGDAEILTAAVQMDNTVIQRARRAVRAGRSRQRERRHGQQAQQHDQYKNHGKHFFRSRSFPCLVHSCHSFRYRFPAGLRARTRNDSRRTY